MGNTPKDISKKKDSKSPVQSDASPPQSDPSTSNQEVKTEVKAEPLAPPPRPDPTAGDYFTQGGHSSEANPFDFSFAGQSGATPGGIQTPGGSRILPPISEFTSPSLNFLASSSTPWGSLRSGPLSPAMLSGPQPSRGEDYFSDSHHLRGGFPSVTPNESSLRSGLTPGGSGSMFPPAPTPGGTALFDSLTSGGATPTTLDFHRTALDAAARNRRDHQIAQQSITSQPQGLNGMGARAPAAQFEGSDANDAANGLYLLAQSSNNTQAPNHYAQAPTMQVHAHPQVNMGGNSQQVSPTMGHRNNGSISTTSGRGVSEMSDEQEVQSRPNTRGKGKRNSTQANLSNGRKDTAKAPANKKSKGNNAHVMEPEPMSEEEQQDMSKDEYNANGKKMTDEEKRKNFLERNRVAALKCRQRKKQWLQNLQNKVEMYGNENENLLGQLSQLREEVVNLKTLLLAHKDCPVTAQQGLQGMVQQLQMDGYGQQMNPYGMAQMNGQPAMNGVPQGIHQQQRRYS